MFVWAISFLVYSVYKVLETVIPVVYIYEYIAVYNEGQGVIVNELEKWREVGRRAQY